MSYRVRPWNLMPAGGRADEADNFRRDSRASSLRSGPRKEERREGGHPPTAHEHVGVIAR